MSYLPSVITLSSSAATLLWQTSSGVSPDTAIAGQVFRACSVNDPLPILIVVPSGTTLYLCTAAATNTTGAVPLVGPFTLPLNIVGNDRMYGIAASGTPTVNVLVGRQ